MEQILLRVGALGDSGGLGPLREATATKPPTGRKAREPTTMKINWKAIVPLLIGAAILVIPVPADLDPSAWQYFALFVTVIAALILEPIPTAAVGLIGVT